MLTEASHNNLRLYTYYASADVILYNQSEICIHCQLIGDLNSVMYKVAIDSK